MRKGTKSFLSIVSLGLVAAGYQAGNSAQLNTGFSAAASPITSGAGTGVAGTTPIAAGTSAGSETLNTATPSTCLLYTSDAADD